MSDEERDEEHLYEGPEEGESEFEWLQRLPSPELQWRHLFNKLIARVETNEKRVEAYDEESRQRDARIESKIEFIVNQQAQFAADIQMLGEANMRTDSTVERLAAATLRRFESAEGEVSGLERKMEALVDSHIRLADTQKEADERLNAFIATVERLISERRNGGDRREGS